MIFRLIICLAVVGIVFGFDDQDIQCRFGEKISKIRRGAAEENAPITGSCQPLSELSEKIKVVCERREPLQCRDGQVEEEACKTGEWLAGFHSYQLKSSRANLIVPICCSSDDIKIDESDCQQKKLNGFLQPINYAVAPNNVISKLSCSFVKDKLQNVLDMIISVRSCSYTNVSGKSRPVTDKAVTAQASSPSSTADTSSNSSSEKRSQSADLRGGLSESNGCPPCDCNCPPVECEGKVRAKRQDSSRKSSDKSCVCDCSCQFDCE